MRPLYVLMAGWCILACADKTPVEDLRFDSPDKLFYVNWKCHTQYDISKDSVSEDMYLKVTTYQGLYPGFQWTWASGDWTGFAQLCFEARSFNEQSERFYLTVWDGKEPYDYQNRFQREFILTDKYQIQCLNLEKGLRDKSGRDLDMSHIKKVVFFGSHPGRPHLLGIKTVIFRL